jgi:hypothetical protein
MLYQVDDASLHAMSGIELSRVRTELRLLPHEPINKSLIASRGADIVMQSSENRLEIQSLGVVRLTFTALLSLFVAHPAVAVVDCLLLGVGTELRSAILQNHPFLDESGGDRLSSVRLQFHRLVDNIPAMNHAALKQVRKDLILGSLRMGEFDCRNKLLDFCHGCRSGPW